MEEDALGGLAKLGAFGFDEGVGFGGDAVGALGHQQVLQHARVGLVTHDLLEDVNEESTSIKLHLTSQKQLQRILRIALALRPTILIDFLTQNLKSLDSFIKERPYHLSLLEFFPSILYHINHIIDLEWVENIRVLLTVPFVLLVEYSLEQGCG